MILVTGASGFLGSHLLQSLRKQSLPVRALYNNRPPVSHLQDENIQWRRCNLLDITSIEEVMQGVSHIFHCAAIVSFDPGKSRQMIRDNVTITENLINAALGQRVEKFMHVSSVAAIGRSATDNTIDQPIDEGTAWVPGKNNSAYAESKYLSELEAWRGFAEGLNVTIVNPSLILGEGDWDKSSAHLIKIIDSEFPWFTKGINAWVDVRDVVEAMVLLMSGPTNGERYIISAGNYSYKDIFTRIAQALGKRPPYKRAGKWMTELVWRLELIKSRLAGKEANISKASARTAQAVHFYDNSKFLKCYPEFKYRPIEQTIGRIADAFKESYRMKLAEE